MDGKCGHHPDRDAEGGICGRCGTYLCAECPVPESDPVLCKPCLARLDRGRDVRHLRILGVLLMVHGALLAATGAYYVLFGGFVLEGLADIPADPADPASEIAPGILQAVAGRRLFRYQGWVLGWIAAIFGLTSLLGCYCAPTAVLLAGYAAWVLSRDDVRARLAVGVPPATQGP